MQEIRVSRAIVAYFSREGAPDYRVELVGENPGKTRVRVTFLSGSTYCCAESGCHFSIVGLRRFVEQQGWVLPEAFRVEFLGVVEAGAVLQLPTKHGDLVVSQNYEYTTHFETP